MKSVIILVTIVLLLGALGCASIVKIVEAEGVYNRSHDISYTNIGIQGQATIPGMVLTPGASIGYTKIIIHTGKDNGTTD